MKFVGLVFIALLAISLSICDKMSEGLDRGLEEEKSYTRHAMETYRKDPTIFQGDKDILETWSRSDYVALAVAKRKIPGDWASTTDKLNFLEPKIQHDTAGKPFCVIQQNSNIFVLTMLSDSVKCAAELVTRVDTSRIDSGDLEFSGRSDYWIYALRAP